ncbi:MAG TPA: mannitol dehydrogenase [Candidatus Limiplasma sp.]|nr:mannitol dehydrogenase [Candidatus Limiplasma sp.]
MTKQEPYALMIGAGHIGRGFIGQLFSLWGFPIVFSEIDSTLTALLNKYRQYPVVLLSGEAEETFTVRNVCAVNGADTDAVAKAVAGAAIAAVSVGANALPTVAFALAKGIALRCAQSAPPLNLLICENLLDGEKHLKSLLQPYLNEPCQRYLDTHIGLVETSVGRMIPVQTDAMRAVHPLAVFAESFTELPADRTAFRGGVPDYPHLKPYAPFPFYVQRKMFVFNMGHTAAAWLGMRKGYEYIWQAMEDAEIRAAVRAAMLESCTALSRAYGEDLSELTDYTDDLLCRFQNRRLMDTAQRVGRDLPRKLSANERFFGAAALCEVHRVPCPAIRAGIRAGLGLPQEPDLPLTQLRLAADRQIDFLRKQAAEEQA